MNKYLVIVSESIKEKKGLNTNFLFPLKDFCVGYTLYFELNEIKEEDAYILINRLLNTKDIENLKNILKNIPKNIKGIVFEDLGVYELIKDKKIEKILYATHANCSLKTINTYLQLMDSVVISPDITKEEVIDILDKAIKPLIVYGFGHLPYMYSRRTLLTNYHKHYEIENKNVISLKETVTKTPFFAVENNYGTVLYDSKLYRAIEFIKSKNIKYILLNSFRTNMNEYELIDAYVNGVKNSTTGFLDKKISVRLKEEEK